MFQLIICLVALILPAQLQAQQLQLPATTLKYMEECGKEYKVADVFQVPADKNCFHKCVAEKVGMMDKDGQLRPESFEKYLKDQNLPGSLFPKVEKCFKLKGADACATASVVRQCIYANVKDDLQG